ncbi:MAG: ABC transporter substrate-binding protein [Deltaproteobacteria bacterium]|jgi:NitT/TauT family transport system substrate-binding protein|nr:ABC transporter substrate-binding protein [Deltaproteobacteria bacterium]
MRILLSLILVTMMMVGITYAEEPEKKQITVSAQWKIGPSTAYWVIAKEKGFYDNLGFEVNIVGNTSSKVVIAGLESGQLDFGSPAAYFLAGARSQGFKGKMLLCYVPMPQLGIIYHTNRNIKSPKDLEGKTLGGVPGTSDIMLFSRFAITNGISIEKVKLEKLSYGVLHGMFFEGKLDGMATFMPYLARYKSEGHQVAGFPYGDYGIYFNGITASEKFLKENPITTKRFIQATQKAFAWIYEHPKESIDLFFEAQPELKSDNPQTDYDQFDLVMSTHYDEIGHKKGLGWMIDSKWRKTLQFAAENFGAKINFSPNEIYTNEFLMQKN